MTASAVRRHFLTVPPASVSTSSFEIEIVGLGEDEDEVGIYELTAWYRVRDELQRLEHDAEMGRMEYERNRAKVEALEDVIVHGLRGDG
jgi:hypothetical protein